MTTLDDLKGTTWSGSAELWLDPLGDSVIRSACTLSIEAHGVEYTWSHDGTLHTGNITLNDDGAAFTDTWHQPQAMMCRHIADARGLFQIEGTYGPQLEWGWRTSLSFREPTGEIVLQMTNIAPWGEEARAVRLTCQRDNPPDSTA